MGIELVTPRDAVAASVQVLSLDPGALGLTSVEVVAASLRRAASFLCPVGPGQLIRIVDETLSGLPEWTEESRQLLEATLDALLLYGDLIELPASDENGRRRQLFLGPPAFVRRESGAILLMGIRPEGAALLSGDLGAGVECDGHVRFLHLDSADPLVDDGLIEMQPDQWIRTPPIVPADEIVADYTMRVETAGDAGQLDGVRVLDWATRPTYYRGRWREPSPRDNGFFVARRPQGYGADLWCFLEVADGAPRRGIDLPVQAPLGPGADEAWRLQAAIDALNERPQQFTTRPAGREGWFVVDLFSPIPSWGQRRLDHVGTPLDRSRGALLSYALPAAELNEETRFLESMMWLSRSADEGGSDG